MVLWGVFSCGLVFVGFFFIIAISALEKDLLGFGGFVFSDCLQFLGHSDHFSHGFLPQKEHQV